MKLLRSHIKIKKLNEDEDSYVDLPAQERLSIIWEITSDIWTLRGEDAERRLQRNVANLIKNKESTGREKDKLDAGFLKGTGNR